MTEQIKTEDKLEFSEDGKTKLPSGLNILIILTFIGCGVGLLLTFLFPMIFKFLLGAMQKAQSSGSELTTKQITDMEKGKASMELYLANLVPLTIVGLLGIILCIVGAVWMRKLKKDGFWIYVGGELLPLIGSLIILGTSQFTGVSSVIMGVGLPLLFVFLYARQRKYLVK